LRFSRFLKSQLRRVEGGSWGGPRLLSGRTRIATRTLEVVPRMGSFGEERGERSDGVEGRVAIIVEIRAVDVRHFLFGICVGFYHLFTYFNPDY